MLLSLQDHEKLAYPLRVRIVSGLRCGATLFKP